MRALHQLAPCQPPKYNPERAATPFSSHTFYEALVGPEPWPRQGAARKRQSSNEDHHDVSEGEVPTEGANAKWQVMQCPVGVPIPKDIDHEVQAAVGCKLRNFCLLGAQHLGQAPGRGFPRHSFDD